ncbi:response regulator [Mycolicibacterium moriokaense]|nr:response regulator [Mycolicibacterium moriokaense]
MSSVPDNMQRQIVDDNADFVAAARGLLERQGMTIVGVASAGADALRGYQNLRPDVTLVDGDLGPERGFAVAERLHQASAESPSPVILISIYAEREFADLIAAARPSDSCKNSPSTSRSSVTWPPDSVDVEKSDHR